MVRIFMLNANKYTVTIGRAVAFLGLFEKTPNLLTQRPANALYIVVSGGLGVWLTPNLLLTQFHLKV